MTEFDAVERQISAVAEAQMTLDRQTARLKRALGERTDALSRALRHLALDLLDRDEKVPQQLIHRLYWESPSLNVSEIYQAFGLRGPQSVASLAGARDVDFPCRDCGEAQIFTVTNRSELSGIRAKHPYCKGCVDRRARERAPETAREAARQREEDRIEDEMLAQAMARYVLEHPDLPDELPGVSMFVSISGARWGGTTVSLGDLLEVRDELRVRGVEWMVQS